MATYIIETAGFPFRGREVTESLTAAVRALGVGELFLVKTERERRAAHQAAARTVPRIVLRTRAGRTGFVVRRVA